MWNSEIVRKINHLNQEGSKQVIQGPTLGPKPSKKQTKPEVTLIKAWSMYCSHGVAWHIDVNYQPAKPGWSMWDTPRCSDIHLVLWDGEITKTIGIPIIQLCRTRLSLRFERPRLRSLLRPNLGGRRFSRKSCLLEKGWRSNPANSFGS